MLPIQKHPYFNADLKGFTPYQPYKKDTIVLLAIDSDINFTLLSELNVKLNDWTPKEASSILNSPGIYTDIEAFNSLPSTDPDSPTTVPETPTVPAIGPLAASIMAGIDKFSFLSYQVPGFLAT